MPQYTMATARKSFAEIADRAKYLKERAIVTNHGKAVLAMVPIEDLEFLEIIEEMIDLQEAQEALEEANTAGTISLDEVRRRLGLSEAS